jgi:hypothetical protein
MITIAFKDRTVAKDNTRANNTRISVEVVSRSICPSKWCKIVCSENLVRILVVIISLFDGRRKCVVVEDVSRGGGGETHRGRYGSGKSGQRRRGWSRRERNGVDVVKVETIKVMCKVESVAMSKDGEGGVVGGDGFVDGRNEFLLGANATGVARCGSPGECHVVDNSDDALFQSSACGSSREKFLNLCTEKGNEIGREGGILVLREKNRVIDGVARNGVKEFVGKTNRDSLNLGVLGTFGHSRTLQRKC